MQLKSMAMVLLYVLLNNQKLRICLFSTTKEQEWRKEGGAEQEKEIKEEKGKLWERKFPFSSCLGPSAFYE